MLNDNQNVLRTFSYYPGVDKPHSVMTDTATYYYATDPTGSVIGLAEFDGAASVVNHYRYDVWGMPQGNETEGAENPIRFKARWWDEDTELLDFRSRWYDPEIGRFISEDPIGLAGGINVYRFVGNNPVHGWDPYGLDPDDPDCDEEATGQVVGYDPDTGIPILETLEVCAEQDGGGSVPIPAGPQGSPLPLGGNKSAPGAGPGPSRNSPNRPHELHKQQCITDAVLFGVELGFEAIGWGAVNAVGMARGAKAVANASAAGDVRSAVATTRMIAVAGTSVGGAINPDATRNLPGTNFAQLGRDSENLAAHIFGIVAEVSRAAPIAGSLVQGAAAGRSCLLWGFSYVM